jgi:hypothetical protein
MCPLFGEFAPEPSSPRVDDARKRREFEEEFKRSYDQRNRMLPPAEIERRNRAMQTADYFLNLHKQQEAQEAADLARRLAAQKAREDAERQQREREQRRRDFAFGESQVDALLDEHGATAAERSRVSQAIVESGQDINDPQVTWFFLMKVRGEENE